jgi:hypothetical protein
VSCRYHLLLDVAADGRLLTMRELDENDADSIVDALEEMPETCALDVEARGGVSSTAVGVLLGIGARKVEMIIRGVGSRHDREDFDEHEHPEDPYVKYTNMGADELAEIAAELRARGKVKP